MKEKKHLSVRAIENGTVIDHIPPEHTLLAVETLTGADDTAFIGLNLDSNSGARKGIIKIEDKVLSQKEEETLGSLAPGATINVIEDFNIVRKYKVAEPQEVFDFFQCANANCITNHEGVSTRFAREPEGFKCHYCERIFGVGQLVVTRPRY